MIKRTLQVFPSPCCVTGAVIAIFSLPCWVTGAVIGTFAVVLLPKM